jgi:hypothetical protein
MMLVWLILISLLLNSIGLVLLALGVRKLVKVVLWLVEELQ